jgi:hypothetical protein
VRQRRQLEQSDGLFDNYTSVLLQFKENIEWRKMDNDRWVPWPKPGLDPDIDSLLEKLTRLKTQLKEYIGDIRKRSGCTRI